MLFRINNTTFEFLHNKLIINGKTVDCSSKLYQAFDLFLNSNNEVISKDDLISSMWGDLIVSDDSLFKIIQSARNTFRQFGLDGNVLVNVYGKGYKISPTIHKIIEAPILENSQQQQNQTKNKYRYAIITSLIIVFTLVFILFLTKEKNLSEFTDLRYKIYKQKIEQDPSATLKELNEITGLGVEDLTKLNFLKGYANFNRGHYKEALLNFDDVTKIQGIKTNIAIADSYRILSLIHLYKADDQTFLKYFTKAGLHYKELNNTEGVYEIENLKIGHQILIHNYSEAIILSNKLLEKSKKEKYILGGIFANLNLYEIYKELNEQEKAEHHIQATLDIASKSGNGKYLAIAYGVMAVDSINNGNFISAMKRANQTLKYAVVQPNTNNFQQGFSYMYNILSTLGHNQLAEKYLQKAIDVQDHFNSDGHIHIAEINLGILKIKLEKYKQAKDIFDQLLTYNLTEINKHTVKSWIAINSYYLDDNISAYTSAKEVYRSDTVNTKNKFIAGIALVLSSIELERNTEAVAVFTNTTNEANSDWLIAYGFYLEMALKFTEEFNKNSNKYQLLKKKFETRITEIKQKTQPDKDTLKALDVYLERILM